MATGGMMFQQTVAGKTVPSFWAKLLIWTLPVVIILFAVFVFVGSYSWVTSAREITGTVIETGLVLDNRNDQQPLEPPQYWVKFAYSDSNETQSGVLSTGSNIAKFGVGDEHQLLLGVEGNIRLTGFAYNYVLALIIGFIGFASAMVSLLLWIWIKALANRQDKKKDVS